MTTLSTLCNYGKTRLSVAYSAQFEFKFLTRVRVRTSVYLVTSCSLDICLHSGGKLRPLPVSKLTLFSIMDQHGLTYRQWSETLDLCQKLVLELRCTGCTVEIVHFD